MYKLPESVDDFNSKYHRSIAFLEFKNKELPKQIAVPIQINRIEIEKDETFSLSYFGITGGKTRKAWNSNVVRLSNIVSLEFPLPEAGYYCVPGFFPCFLDRKAVRSVHRGWSETALSLNTLDIFKRMKTYDYMKGFHVISSVMDVNFVEAYFNKPPNPPSFDTFIPLSTDFLAVKAGKKHALFYQNFMVGECDLQKSNYDLKINSSVKGLEDVFHYQVGNR